MFGVLVFGTSQSIFSQSVKSKSIPKAQTVATEKADANNDTSSAAEKSPVNTSSSVESGDGNLATAVDTASLGNIDDIEGEDSGGLHKMIKTKFIEGNAGFMSLVAIALVLGLAFCIERIIYLSLSEIDAKKLMLDIEGKLNENDVEGAKDVCRNTRGPVASICYQGLSRINEHLDDIERSITSYGMVQSSKLEKGCTWVTLFIAMAPSLGFLGTVIGMVMAFDNIQAAGDISPTIVAGGMKVALITTIFGIIVALILQIFYNYILSKIEHITSQMEESSITLMDMIVKYNLKNRG